jgi:hypothetical protein
VLGGGPSSVITEAVRYLMSTGKLGMDRHRDRVANVLLMCCYCVANVLLLCCQRVANVLLMCC